MGCFPLTAIEFDSFTDIYNYNNFVLRNSVAIANGYGLDSRMIGVRFPARAGNFSLRHRVQTGSGAHPASYPMGAAG
jgi:hypothetical protein